LTKIILTFAIVIGLILQWATTSVCRYNFTIDKKTQALNIISDEVNPSLGTTNTYYFHELNCNDANFSFDITRLEKNIRAISVMVYQELTTDIKGNKN
tara:strand:- start:169 stop:462 length:294 start_codon:yes stop_codon:yes gene_type:complete